MSQLSFVSHASELSILQGLDFPKEQGDDLVSRASELSIIQEIDFPQEQGDHLLENFENSQNANQLNDESSICLEELRNISSDLKIIDIQQQGNSVVSEITGIKVSKLTFIP